MIGSALALMFTFLFDLELIKTITFPEVVISMTTASDDFMIMVIVLVLYCSTFGGALYAYLDIARARPRGIR